VSSPDTPVSSPDTPVSSPDTLVGGRYRLVEQVAAGGMGSVWRAWDDVLQRPVALKQLHPQPGLTPEQAQLASSRAMREARITARLHHPNAVPVYDVVDYQGQPCLVMQYLPSRSLQAVLADRGALTVPEVARIGSEVAAALAAAHRAGVVHRDVKPGNILIDQEGTAKVTDFGISHALGDATLTSTGIVTGTPAFLAPEVARGVESGFASDVFSLGSTLYAALEGTPPFGTSENPMAVLHRAASGQIDPPRRSGPLTDLLLRMLAPDPAARPVMDEVAGRLAAVPATAANPANPANPALAATWAMPAPPPLIAPSTTMALPAVGPAPPLPHEAWSQAPPRPPEPPPSAGWSEPPPRRRRTALLAALGAVLLVLTVAGVLVARAIQNSNGGQGPVAGATRSTTARTSAPPHSSAAATSSQPTASTSSAPETSPISAGGEGAAKPGQLTRAVKDYYDLLPKRTDEAWARLTSSYQATHAGGWDAYQTFWDSIDKVDVSGATANPPGSVAAMITYTYQDGRVVAERTVFGLVRQGGVLKIDSTSVLSSSTR
jgi:serine/threonine protein kinase